MPLPLTNAQRTLPTTRAADAPPPEPGDFFDIVGDAFTSARADTTGYVEEKQLDAYKPVITALEDQGYRWTQFVNIGKGTVSPESVWAAVEKARARDPNAFADLPATMAEFEQRWRGDEAQRITAAQERAAQGGFIPNLLGGMAGAMTDPLNLYTLPAGGAGKTLVTRLLTEGLVNAGIEGVLQPTVQANREALGRPDLTAGEAATNIGFAALGSMAIRGGIEVAPTAVRRLGENVAGDWQRTRDYLWPRLPETVRQRIGSKEALQPEALPDLAEEIIGPGRMTQAERDAVEIARDAAELDRSPFAPNGAGQQLHHDLVGEALDALIDMPPPTRLPVRSAAGGSAEVRPGSRAGRVSGSNAFGDATAEARFMGRVRSAESGGVDSAKNPRSSATGRYQFIDSTWIAQFVKRYGRGGLSDAQILAKRGNGALQDQLMKDLTAENAAFLRSQGEAVTEGNLYLVHFSGSGGAKKVFGAAADTPIERIWSAEVIRANPFLKGMTAGDVISWAHRKMGMQGNSPRAGSGYQVAEGIDGIDAALAREADELETIRRTLDEAYAAEDAARRAAMGEQDSDAVKAALDAEPDQRAFDDGAMFDEASVKPREQLAPEETPEQAALRSALADIVHDSKDSINDFAKLASRLEATEDEVKAALGAMAGRGTITMNRKTGHFMRKPAKDDAELLETVARYGGLRDDEGHALGLTGLSREEARELTASGKKNTVRKRQAKGRRDWNGMMTRNGPLLRHEGRSVDEIGEALWDEGWFTDRPTTAQVLDLIEQRIAGGKKMYPPGAEKAEVETAPVDYLAEADAEWQQARGDFLSEYTLGKTFDDTLADLPDEAIMSRAAELYAWAREDGVELDAETAVLKAVDEEYQRVLEDLAMQDMEAIYGTRFDIFDGNHFGHYLEQLDARRRADGAGGNGRGGAAGDPGTRGQAGENDAGAGADAVDPIRLAELSPEQRSPFSDPDSAAAKQQADSLVHDMRAIEDAKREYEEQFDSPTTPEEAADLLGPEEGDPERADWMEGWALGRNGGESPPPDNAVHDGWTVGNTTFRRQGEPAPKPEANAPYVVTTAKRMGDFIEFFDDEAKTVADALEIAITKRGERPMSGVPVHSYEMYRQAAAEKGITLPALDDELQPVPVDSPSLDSGAKVDPAIAARQAQEAQLRAEAPMRGENKTGQEQDGTMGLGLFDAADQPEFLLDADAPGKTATDLLADIDKAGDDLKNIRDCL